MQKGLSHAAMRSTREREADWTVGERAAPKTSLTGCGFDERQTVEVLQSVNANAEAGGNGQAGQLGFFGLLGFGRSSTVCKVAGALCERLRLAMNDEWDTKTIAALSEHIYAPRPR